MKKYLKQSLKLPKVLAFLLVLTMLASIAITPTYAKSAYDNSIASVDQNDDGKTVGIDTTQEKQTEYVGDITEPIVHEVSVSVTQESSYNVKLPKTLVLNGKYGETNSGTYEVEVEGNLAGDEMVFVSPADADMTLSSTNKEDIIADITQEKISFSYADGVRIGEGVKGTGVVTAIGMTAGKWHGRFDLNVNLSTNSNTELIEYFTWGEDTDVTASYAAGTLKQDYPYLQKEKRSSTSTYSYPDKTRITGLTQAGIEWLQGNGGKLILPECASSTEKWTNYYNGVFSAGNYSGVLENLITSVSIANSVKYIGGGTFAGLKKLKTINTNNVETIGNAAFSSCHGLKSVNLNNKLDTIHGSTFQGCMNLESVLGTDNVKTLESNAFYLCIALKEINLSNCETVGNKVFYMNYNIHDPHFDKNVLKSVGTQCFNYCGISSTYWNNFTGTTFASDAIYPDNRNYAYNYSTTPCNMNINGFSQYNPQWATRKIASNVADDVQFGSRGCTWMVLTAVHNYLNNENWTPVQFAKYFEDNYPAAIPNNFSGSFDYSDSASNAGLTSLGMKYTKITNFDKDNTKIQQIMDALAAHKPVIIDYRQLNLSYGHAVILAGINEDGMVKVINSSVPANDVNSTSGAINIRLQEAYVYYMPIECLLSKAVAYIFESVN